jgi:hypothetical protein
MIVLQTFSSLASLVRGLVHDSHEERCLLLWIGHGLIFSGGDVSYPPYDPTGEEPGLSEVASNGTLARSVAVSHEWNDGVYDMGAADRAQSTSTKGMSLTRKMIAWGEDDPYMTQQAEALVMSVAEWDDSQYETGLSARVVHQGSFRQGNYDTVDFPVVTKRLAYDSIETPGNRASVYDSTEASSPAQYDSIDVTVATKRLVYDSIETHSNRASVYDSTEPSQYESIDVPVVTKRLVYDSIETHSNRASLYDITEEITPSHYDSLDHSIRPQVYDSLQCEPYVSNPYQEVDEHMVYKTRGGIPYASTSEVQYESMGEEAHDV